MAKIVIAALLCITGNLIISASFAATNTDADSHCATDRLGTNYCPAASGQCLKDGLGNVYCSPSGGGAMLDRYQEVVCGTGACTRLRTGEILCAKNPNVALRLPPNDRLECADGSCGKGLTSICQRKTP